MTSRYLDDIFAIDNPAFAEDIPNIYPTELQLNEANTSGKETSFLDSNIKVIRNNIHTSVCNKGDDFGFFTVYFLGWVVMFLDSHDTVFTFRSWFDLLDVALAFLISILEIVKSLQNYWHRVTDITSFCRNFVQYRFENMYLKESLIRSSTVILFTN